MYDEQKAFTYKVDETYQKMGMRPRKKIQSAHKHTVNTLERIMVDLQAKDGKEDIISVLRNAVKESNHLHKGWHSAKERDSRSQNEPSTHSRHQQASTATATPDNFTEIDPQSVDDDMIHKLDEIICHAFYQKCLDGDAIKKKTNAVLYKMRNPTILCLDGLYTVGSHLSSLLLMVIL